MAPTGVLTSPLGIAVLVTLAVTAICAFLPWVTIEGLGERASDNGINKDGTITLGLSLVAAGFFFGHGRTGNKGMAIGSLVCSALCAIVFVIDYFDVASGVDDLPAFFEVKVGYGLWVGMITSIIATVLLLIVLIKAGKKTT